MTASFNGSVQTCKRPEEHSLTAVMPIVRPDIYNWVRDRAPKFVSRATFKNLNRWHRVFDADRRELIAFWLQYCLGLRLFLLLWATEVVCCPLGLRLLRKNRARRSRSRKKACESVFGAALSLRSRSCRRVFCCPVSGAVDFLLSSSYFLWVVWNLVYQGRLVSWRASRPLFGPHGENFDFSTIVRDFVTVERYADRPLPLRAGCVGNFFGTFSSDSLLGAWVWRASVWLPWRGCAEWLRRDTLCQTFLLVENFRRYGESAGPCVEERWWPIIFGSASSWKTMPCCKDVLPSIRQSTWSTVEKIYLFSMQQWKAHLQCKCSWHTHTGSLVTHAAPSRSQTSRGTSPEAGTMTKKLLLRVHASLSFFFLLSDFEMLKNISKFLLLDFVWRSPALTRSRFSWQRRFDVILRGAWGCNSIGRHIFKCPMHNSREPGAVALWRHWIFKCTLGYMHPVMSENEFHCTGLKSMEED